VISAISVAGADMERFAESADGDRGVKGAAEQAMHRLLNENAACCTLFLLFCLSHALCLLLFCIFQAAVGHVRHRHGMPSLWVLFAANI